MRNIVVLFQKNCVGEEKREANLPTHKSRPMLHLYNGDAYLQFQSINLFFYFISDLKINLQVIFGVKFYLILRNLETDFYYYHS